MVTGENLTSDILRNNVEAFYALLRAGLWEQNVQLTPYGIIDYSSIYKLAEEQSVVGLIAAGLEHIVDAKVPKEDVLKFVGTALRLEQRNTAMNALIAILVSKLRSSDIYTLLVKGQGISLCYERPLWRACGDVDFYLSEENFQKAKVFFKPLVDSFDPDDDFTRHINMHYGEWVLEIHANQYCSISSRINKVMKEVHEDLFFNGNVRSWDNKGITLFLPSSDNDILIIFVHFLNHFYKGGVGVRQICDWCRLMYTFKTAIDAKLLGERLRKAGLVSEWKAFAAYAVDYLGMPSDAMPFYDTSEKWVKKAKRINTFILEVGNFGHNRDTSYYSKYPFLIRKLYSFSRRFRDFAHHALIFPLDSVRFLFGMTISGLKVVAHGE